MTYPTSNTAKKDAMYVVNLPDILFQKRLCVDMLHNNKINTNSSAPHFSHW